MTERSADGERSPAATVERATRCHPSPVMELAAPTTRSQSVFGALVTAFVIVMVVRLHEVVPLVGNLRLGKILVLPLAVMTVVALPRWQVIYALRTAVAKWVGVIIGLALLSVPLSIWPTNSARYFLSVLMPALFLFIIVSAGFSDRVAARRCILALVLTVGIDALFILVGPAPRAAGRPYIGAYLDPNESAALFVFTVPFALGLGSPRERRGWLGIAITMLLVAGVVETGSRGGVVGLLIVAVMLILRAAPSARRAYVLAIACCAAVFVSAADDAQLARFGTIFAPKTDYNLTDREGRLQVWRRGVGYMLDRPLFGTGINNFETAEGVLGGKLSMGHGIRYTAAHNSYVQIGAELGVFGLVAFLAVIWSAARGCQRIRQRAVRDRAARGAFADDEAQLASSAFCALVGFAATGFFLSMAYHPVTFFAFAVCAGVQAGSPYRWFDPPRPTRAALSHAEWRRTVELARGAASAHPA